MIVSGKTNSGFTYQIQKERATSFEFFEILADVEDNALLVPKLMKMLLGKAQLDKLKEHVRNDDGFVPTEKMMEELGEMMKNESLKKL